MPKHTSACMSDVDYDIPRMRGSLYMILFFLFNLGFFFATAVKY